MGDRCGRVRTVVPGTHKSKSKSFFVHTCIRFYGDV